MLKKLACLSLFLPLCSVATTVKVNGTVIRFDQQPVEIKGRLMVPLRGVFEAIGAVVDWDDQIRKVTAKKGNEDVELSIGSKVARKDGAEIMLEVPPVVRHHRTLVPLRFLVEALGGSVDYDAASDTVNITSGP